MRLLRALYRFQLCCNLFGKGVDSSRLYFRGLNFDSDDILTIFLCLFEPWEIEEITCIYFFSKEMYHQIFKEIGWDVHPDNPKFDGQGPPTPTGAFYLDINEEFFLPGTSSLGLSVLHSMLITRDHAQRVLAMQEHICYPKGDFLEDESIDIVTQESRRRKHPSHRDQKELRRDPLPFEGDTEPCPTLAWTTIWRGTYSNRYGGYLDEPIRRWGYIMWDAARLEDTGGIKILEQLWKPGSAGWSDCRDTM